MLLVASKLYLHGWLAFCFALCVYPISCMFQEERGAGWTVPSAVAEVGVSSCEGCGVSLVGEWDGPEGLLL